MPESPEKCRARRSSGAGAVRGSVRRQCRVPGRGGVPGVLVECFARRRLAVPGALMTGQQEGKSAANQGWALLKFKKLVYFRWCAGWPARLVCQRIPGGVSGSGHGGVSGVPWASDRHHVTRQGSEYA